MFYSINIVICLGFFEKLLMINFSQIMEILKKNM